MKNVKGWATGILLLAVIGVFAILLTFNLPLEESIAISLDNESQIYLLTEGRDPAITFVSLQDTPYQPNIKILVVSTHFVWGGASNMNVHLSSWLDDLGITSYPDYPIDYIGGYQDKERGK